MSSATLCIVLSLLAFLAVVIVVCSLTSSKSGTSGATASRVQASGSQHTLSSVSEAMSLLSGSSPAVVVFHSVNCGYCKKMMPHLDAISKKWGGKVKVATLEASNMKDLESFKGELPDIPGFPTLVHNLDSGLSASVGYQTEESMHSMLQQYQNK